MYKISITIILVSILMISCSEKELQMQSLYKSSNFNLDLILLEETATNVYIVSNEKKECIIFDPALKTKRIAKTLLNKNYKPKAIFLTHNHWDHSKEINELSDTLNIPVITNIKQIEMGKSPMGTPLTVKNIIEVTDKQVVKFANIYIEVMFSPGHSIGSMCFYHMESNSLFSGDTIFKESIGRTDFDGSEKEKIINSVFSVLKAIKNNTDIYPGHGEKTTKKHELANNPFLMAS